MSVRLRGGRDVGKLMMAVALAATLMAESAGVAGASTAARAGHAGESWSVSPEGVVDLHPRPRPAPAGTSFIGLAAPESVAKE